MSKIKIVAVLFALAAGLSIALWTQAIEAQKKTESPTSVARGAKAPSGAFDTVIRSNAQKMMDEGKQTFRFDTFGSETFFGDALKLHQAISGEKLGGVGAGVSPKTALS